MKNRAKINRKSVEASVAKFEKVLDCLFRLKETCPEFNSVLTKHQMGIKLHGLFRDEQQYVWAKVGVAEYLYPVYSDHRKKDPVAYVVEDVDFVKRNKKDTRWTWRVLGRAGTDLNGWCKNVTLAKEACGKYFNIRENT